MHDAPVAALLDGAGQDPAPQGQRAERLVGVDGAVDGRQRRPGLERGRRRRAGCAAWRSGARRCACPGRSRRSGPSRCSVVDLDAQVGQQQRHHLAGRRRVGSTQAAGLAPVVRDVVVDVGDRARGASHSAQSVARPRRCATGGPSTTTATSGSSAGARAHLVDARQAGERRRHRVGARRPRPACPSRSAAMPQGERRAERVGVGVLVADRRDPAARRGSASTTSSRLTRWRLVLDLAQDAQHAVARLDRVVVPDDQLRDVAQSSAARRAGGAATARLGRAPSAPRPARRRSRAR